MKKRKEGKKTGKATLKRPGLALFIRYPEPGQVKKKLLQSLGPEKAAALFREHSEKSLKATHPEEEDYERIVFYDPAWSEKKYHDWLGDEISLRPQKGERLAERLKNALSEMLKTYQPVIIMGSDKPSLTKNHLLEAFEILRDSEAVLGPTSEGGFYLMGFRRLIPEMFEKTLWSTPFAFDTVFKVLTGMGIDPHLLPVLSEEI